MDGVQAEGGVKGEEDGGRQELAAVGERVRADVQLAQQPDNREEVFTLLVAVLVQQESDGVLTERFESWWVFFISDVVNLSVGVFLNKTNQ